MNGNRVQRRSSASDFQVAASERCDVREIGDVFGVAFVQVSLIGAYRPRRMKDPYDERDSRPGDRAGLPELPFPRESGCLRVQP